MSLLVKPYIGCNLRCPYCYENSYRKKIEKPKLDYNLKAVLKKMEEYKNLDIALHGGEILCLPHKDLETLLSKSYEIHKKSGIQTNATLIDDKKIALFKKYNTHVGISWDGPGELSKFRPGSQKVGKIIDKLVSEGVSVSLIMVINKANAGTKELRKKLKSFLLDLEKKGIRGGRLNPCLCAPEYELSMEKLKEAYLDLADFCLKNNLKWSPFCDLVNGLKNKGRVCTFMGCDIFSTQSATVVLGDGSVVNCMRVNQEYVLLRHPVQYQTRNEILHETPQKYGGCKDCKYWRACYGGCPSSAIDNDWRNRTYICELWKCLFEFYENIFNQLDIPLPALNNNARDEGRSYNEGDGHGDEHGDHDDNAGKDSHGDEHGDEHGDHDDDAGKDSHGDEHGDHHDDGRGDGGHGDIPHGDEHGDHDDDAGKYGHGDEHGDEHGDS